MSTARRFIMIAIAALALVAYCASQRQQMLVLPAWGAAQADIAPPFIAMTPSRAGAGLHVTVSVERASSGLHWNAAALSLSVRRIDAPPSASIGLAPVSPLSPAADAKSSIVFSASDIGAGMFELDAGLPDDVLRDDAGDAVAHLGPYPRRFYLPPPPDGAPLLAVGQRFMAIGNLLEHPIEDRQGRSVGAVILTLVDVEKRPGESTALTFRVGKGPATLTTTTDAQDAMSFTGAAAVIEDANVRKLREEFVGHRVFPLGELPLSCDLQDVEVRTGVTRATPLKVLDVERLSATVPEWGIGQLNARTVDRESSYMSVNPVIITVSTEAAERSFTHYEVSGTRTAVAEFRDRQAFCDRAYVEFSDQWDAERSLGLQDPSQRSDWPKNFRAAAIDGQISKGMTYDMVAVAVGYPNAYGTIADMKRLDTWYYDPPTPFQFTVKFKHGLVVEYDPPGHLP